MATVDFTRIASNIAALNSLNALRSVNNNLALHQARLSTGRRINEAMDDPAGLTLATKLLRRSEGLNQAIDNIGDAKNLLAVAEGGLSKIQDILGKMRVKAEQAASDAIGSAERAAIASDLSQFAQEIDDIVETTTWNSNKLLDTTVGTFEFQTSADTTSSGYTSWTQSVDHAVNGGSLSGLATVSGASSVVETTDPDTILNALTSVAVFDNVETGEINSGVYTVRVVLGAVDGSAADSYAQLIDAQGNLLTVDADGVDGGLLDNKVTFTYDDGGTVDVDFGNGLQITLEAGLTTGAKADATATYTKTGSYAVSLGNAAAARNYMDTVDTAIGTVSSSMADIGALMARFSAKEEVMSVAHTNTEAAFNRIMNADMAFEQLEATKYAILQQTATAMLAQANASAQGVLQLFR